MTRRSFIAVVSGSILVVPFTIVAQQRSKTHRIGLLSPPPGGYVAAAWRSTPTVSSKGPSG